MHYILLQFVDGIKPMWEDEANKKGGRWTLRVQKGFANQLWEDLVLATIGEQFQDANEINGIVVSIRPHGDQIQIWTRNGKDANIIQRIKKDLIQLLQLPDTIKMEYDQFFKDEKIPPPQRQYPRQGGPPAGSYHDARRGTR